VIRRARDLARRLRIVDAHIDLPWRLRQRMEDVGAATGQGDFDYPRARRGGLDVAFLSIYVPTASAEAGDARAEADGLIDIVEALAREHPDKFAIVSDVAGARARFGDGRVALALGLENGAPIGEDLAALGHFYRRGIRYVTLTHAAANQLCDSSYGRRPWGGLSPFGREVVGEMNRLGMMVDVSHATDEAFFQVLERSRAPVIASHSSCRHFTPGWERNLSDEMIRCLADHGGAVQINFGSSFINDGFRRRREALREQIDAQLDAAGIPRESAEAATVAREHFARHPIPRAELAEVVDHIEHVVRLVGIDHVGLGSDFEGVGDTLPVGLEDVSTYPHLISELLRRGWDEASIEQVCSENLLRVWSAVERIAAEERAEGR
jgi:membrane dipeptidase